MKIKKLLEGITILAVSNSFKDIEIKDIGDDSRQIKSGFVFVAVRGSVQDGHCYIQEAVRRNAAAIVLDDQAYMPRTKVSIPYILVNDSKSALGRMSDIFFGYPYQSIPCIGITGTNGKTTVSYLIRSILKAAGIKCGLIGTLGYQIDEVNVSLGNTTPGVIELHRLFREMIASGNQYVVLEVSSHALDQERVTGLIFKTAIFTNLTQDHLDYHKTMEDYFVAKQRLFKEHIDTNTNFIINGDDPFGRRLLSSVRGKVFGYGFSPESDVRVCRYELGRDFSHVLIRTPEAPLDISTRLIGKHNLYNILASVAFGISKRLNLGDIKRGIENLKSIPGRLDRIDSSGGFSVFVDYAHTDDALKNVLESLRSILHNGRIITVFGCGGDRDKEKRPKMGKVASLLSDYCFVTCDNPRSEDPGVIIKHIIAGIEKKNFQVEEDRFLAIKKAIQMARENDFVLIAGKGHETYQLIKDKKFPFDDKAMVLKILTKLKKNV